MLDIGSDKVSPELLRRLFPLAMLSNDVLQRLHKGLEVINYTEEDYVFRLGEDLPDLFYVLKGVVQVMDIEGKSKQEISAGSENANQPFSVNVAHGAVAIAKTHSSVLKIDYRLLCELMPGKEALAAKVKPGRKAEVIKAVETPAYTGPDFLEVPEGFVESLSQPSPNIPKPEPARKPVVRKDKKAGARPAPVEKQRSKTQRRPPVQNKPVKVAKPVQEKKRSAVSSMMSDLKTFLGSDIVLEPKIQKTAENEAAKSGFLAGAKEVLLSDIKLAPKVPKKAAVSAIPVEQKHVEIKTSNQPVPEPKPGPEQPAPEKTLSEKELRELETQEYLRAMSLFNKQKWESAHSAFKALYAANPRTNLYKEYVTRCEEKLSKWY